MGYFEHVKKTELEKLKAKALEEGADIHFLSQIKEPYLSFILAVLYAPLFDVKAKNDEYHKTHREHIKEYNKKYKVARSEKKEK